MWKCGNFIANTAYLPNFQSVISMKCANIEVVTFSIFTFPHFHIISLRSQKQKTFLIFNLICKLRFQNGQLQDNGHHNRNCQQRHIVAKAAGIR
jgi:hypothetical protein